MKRASIIFLISVYLFPSLGLNEFFKINALLSHYAETKKLTPSITAIEFLVEHYLTDDGNPNDNDSDLKLPFKSTDKDSMESLVFIPAQFSILVKATYTYKAIDFFPKNESPVQTNFYNMVWHPPQVS